MSEIVRPGKGSPTTYAVAFDRLGRTHNPPPLTVECPEAADADGRAPDVLLTRILDYATGFCGSHDLEVCATVAGDEFGGPRGYVLAGVRRAGDFTLRTIPAGDAA